MIRTQVQLSEEQAKALRQLAARQGVSIAELVRRGVDLLIKDPAYGNHDERIKRAIALAGRFKSGLPDLAKNHDKYLSEAYRS